MPGNETSKLAERQAITNNTISLFDAVSEGMATIKPNQGGSTLTYDIPANGEYVCQVIDIVCAPYDYRAKGQTYPGVTAQFVYKIINDPMSAEETGRMWYGETFRFPQNPSAISDEGTQEAIRIAKERLAGHIKALLDRQPSGSLATDLQRCLDLVRSGNQVICKVKVADRPKNGYRNAEEYLTQKVSS